MAAFLGFLGCIFVTSTFLYFFVESKVIHDTNTEIGHLHLKSKIFIKVGTSPSKKVGVIFFNGRLF